MHCDAMVYSLSTTDLLANSPNIMSPFKPPRTLRHPHIQSIFNSKGPREIRAKKLLRSLNSRPLTLHSVDGARLLAEWDCSSGDCAAPGRRLVVLLHGWEGSSGSSYSVTTASSFLAAGFDVLRVNFRDHGDSHHLNPELFNTERHDEVAAAIGDFLQRHPYPQVVMAGYSMGGNFTLRIAADFGQQLGLHYAVAVCPPTDPYRSMQAINRGSFIYRQYFYRKWRKSLQKKLHCWPELDYGDILATARNLDDLNNYFIPRFSRSNKVEDYFASYAITGERLANLALPAMLIATEDDPVIPIADLDRINAPELLQIERHRYGGHCGFIANWRGETWIEQRMVALFEQALG
ncbi:alpha/beta fold hydrolase [Gammaproteobacteria bacterium LSUCC0057]|uniref:Alpha/beta fold hydrolase n=1 Tax=Gammaproteobacteria bacterium LSUCC0057 TaxID=2559237 RepID=A0A4Y8UIC3_9GAMM|nr:alpha/beta fold hydrolase [Gammaproteobacteria bacterium LSUCC0057]